MKIDRSILAAALGLASVSLASASQYVYMTGSTAARAAVYNTLIAGNGFDSVPAFVGYGSAVPANCSWMAFSNTIGGTPTIVKCHWSGSEAGIADVGTVAGPLSESFQADPNGTAGNPNFINGTPQALTSPSSPASTSSQVVDIAQADNSISYSHIPGAACIEYNDSLVIPFIFVKNGTTIANQALLTDITYDNFYQLANGGDKLGLFTGNNADTKYVYLTGRDNNSGTRVNVFGDTGWGINKLPNQVNLSGGALVNFGTALAPNYYTVQGQSSGGTLANSLVDTTSSADSIHGGTGFIAVSYLGLADNATAVGLTPPAVDLSFNGVSYSVANVQNGTYALWGYEFTEVNPNDDGSGNASDVIAQAIVVNLPANTSGNEISTSTMHAKRSGPTGHPYHL